MPNYPEALNIYDNLGNMIDRERLTQTASGLSRQLNAATLNVAIAAAFAGLSKRFDC